MPLVDASCLLVELSTRSEFTSSSSKRLWYHTCDREPLLKTNEELMNSEVIAFVRPRQRRMIAGASCWLVGSSRLGEYGFLTVRLSELSICLLCGCSKGWLALSRNKWSFFSQRIIRKTGQLSDAVVTLSPIGNEIALRTAKQEVGNMQNTTAPPLSITICDRDER